jgi:hypothetical protein
VAVLTDGESREVFGLPLADKDVQPVWISIENRGEAHAWFFPITVDDEYFASLEVSYPHHSWLSEEMNRTMDRYFEMNQIGSYIPPADGSPGSYTPVTGWGSGMSAWKSSVNKGRWLGSDLPSRCRVDRLITSG